MDEEFVKRLEEEQEVPQEEEVEEEEIQDEEGEAELAPLPELADDFDYGNEQPLQDNDEEGEE